MATSEKLIAAGLEQLSDALVQIRTDTVGKIDRLEHTVAELDTIWRKRLDLLSEAMRKHDLASIRLIGHQRDSQRSDEDTQRKVAHLEAELIQLRNRLPESGMESRLRVIEQTLADRKSWPEGEFAFEHLDAFIPDSNPGLESMESDPGMDHSRPADFGPIEPQDEPSWACKSDQPDASPAPPASTSECLAPSIQHGRKDDLDLRKFRAGYDHRATDQGHIFAPGAPSMAPAANESPRSKYFFWVLGALFGIAALATILVLGKRERGAAIVAASIPSVRTLSLPEPTVRDPNDTLFVVEIPQTAGLAADLQNSYSSPGEQGAISEKALRDMAKNGNPKANTILGLRALDDGGAAPVSLPDAVRYLKRAAAGGNPVAQFRLASLYEHGDGIAADLANAKHWYELAANQGNRKAMHNLAVFYSSGAAGGKDLQQAAYWFSEAASLGVTDSQFNLAFLYEHGYGVTKSLVEAGKWYSIAARSGDKESKRRAELLQAQLGTAERALVSRAAKDFRALPFDAAANVPPDTSSL